MIQNRDETTAGLRPPETVAMEEFTTCNMRSANKQQHVTTATCAVAASCDLYSPWCAARTRQPGILKTALTLFPDEDRNMIVKQRSGTLRLCQPLLPGSSASIPSTSWPAPCCRSRRCWAPPCRRSAPHPLARRRWCVGLIQRRPSGKHIACSVRKQFAAVADVLCRPAPRRSPNQICDISACHGCISDRSGGCSCVQRVVKTRAASNEWYGPDRAKWLGEIAHATGVCASRSVPQHCYNLLPTMPDTSCIISRCEHHVTKQMPRL